MHINKAILHIKEIVNTAINRMNQSADAHPNDDSIKNVELCMEEFKSRFHMASQGKSNGQIWPKMITRFIKDNKEGLIPVWGPITNSKGEILGARFVTKDPDTRPPRTNVYLEWHSPE